MSIKAATTASGIGAGVLSCGSSSAINPLTSGRSIATAGIVQTAAVPLMARANTDNATIDFRVRFLLGGAVSRGLSVVSVLICVSDVVLTCIDLKKRSRRGIVHTTAPLRALP